MAEAGTRGGGGKAEEEGREGGREGGRHEAHNKAAFGASGS